MISADAATALDALTAWSTFGTGAVALIAVGGAWVVGRGQVKEARAARELTRLLDVERSQPYVVAYMESSEASQQIIQLVIKNFGLTAAHNVRLRISPWPERSEMPPEYREVGIPSAIPILAPGQSWQTIWDVSSDRKDTDLPDRHEGTVTYDGLEGAQMETPIVLDWSIFKERMHTDVKTIHHAAKSLSEIDKTLKKLREFPNGLKVYVRDGDARDSRRTEAAQQYRDPAARSNTTEKQED